MSSDREAITRARARLYVAQQTAKPHAETFLQYLKSWAAEPTNENLRRELFRVLEQAPDLGAKSVEALDTTAQMAGQIVEADPRHAAEVVSYLLALEEVTR